MSGKLRVGTSLRVGLAAVVAIVGTVITIASSSPLQVGSDPNGLSGQAAGSFHGQVACDTASRCDRLTGCVAPAPPPGSTAKILPEGDEYRRYVDALQEFQACRQQVLASRFIRQGRTYLVSLDPSEQRKQAFAETVQSWNGNVLWEPASASNDIITRFGDEARAVFGPVPEGNCASAEAKTFPLEVDGNIVDLRPNAAKAGHPLEFEHRDTTGRLVKWTSSIPACDKPSLAGNVAYCALNSRLNRVMRGNVEWLFLCRKSNPSLEVSSDPYWQRSDPRFSVFGTIGFNRKTGEIVFFDGRKDRSEFDWSHPFVPPGGSSYSDKAGRAAAQALYDPTFRIQCFACHDNKNAYVIDPHAGQARVGYVAGVKDPRAIAFSLGDYLPRLPRQENTPFRVIGSGYTATYVTELSHAKTVADPTGNCTSCHTLTTLVTGRRFAADAVAREPWIAQPSWAQLLEQLDEKTKHAQVAIHRTPWALRSGEGKIHPWMVPDGGNRLLLQLPEISDADWQKLSNCLWDAGGSECGYRPLYTSCPKPGSGSDGDGVDLKDAAVQALPEASGERGTGRVLRVSWRYLNAYGDVAQRDDVRFNVAIKETGIPESRRAPAEREYPSMDEAKGVNFIPMRDEIGTSGSASLIQNASYLGHLKWTDPVASTSPRDFRIDLPGTCNRRYLIRILPKRFCFDQANVTFGGADHLLYADIVCD